MDLGQEILMTSDDQYITYDPMSGDK